MTDTYRNFAELAAANTIGLDYEIESRPVSGTHALLHMAIHGGAIESPTTRLAQYCAGSTGAYYTFSGVRSSNNAVLHVTATNFDEPTAMAQVTRSAFTVSWHGTAGSAPVTYVGGLDTYSSALVVAELEAAGFVCATAPQNIAGIEPTNICNRNIRHAGVQLEISLAQRQAMYFGGNLTASSVTVAANRTQAFYAYTAAVMRAMTAAMTPPPAVRPDPSAAPGRPAARRPGVAVQMAVPFALAADGSIAVVQDEAQAVSDRVRALVGTLPGERVMRDDYGVPTSEALFAPDAATASAEVQLMVSDAVTAFEPTAVLTQITPHVDMDLGVVDVDVRVGRADVPQAERSVYKNVSIAVGGATTETPS